MDHDGKPARISTLDEPGVILEEMVRDVRAGLSTEPKDLSMYPKYLYDDEGSRIFEEITNVPEYYQTGAELSILQGNAASIVSRTGCSTLVELGSGSSSKTRTLLAALLDAPGPARYEPLDVSESALKESGEQLAVEYPDLDIQGYVGDFDKSLPTLLESADHGSGGRLIAFLGGTIGNFSPEGRREFLRTLQESMSGEDRILIGLDLVKDRAVLEAAYDDAAGVTARFNKNLLNVLNYRLGANFDPDLFDHRATYDETNQRIEMWLDSRKEQEISLRMLEMDVHLERNEGIRTEISNKFTPESAASTLDEAAFQMLQLYTDERDLFGLALAAPLK